MFVFTWSFSYITDDFKTDLVICFPGCGYHLLRELCSDCAVFRTHWCVQHAVWFSPRTLWRGQGWVNPILNIRCVICVNSSLISIAFCVCAAHAGPVRGVAVDALNQLTVSVGADRLLKIWKFKSKEELHTHSLPAAPASSQLHRDRY